MKKAVTPEHESRAMEVFGEFGATGIETTEELGWQKRAEVP